jgi:hypothetical protein
MSIQEYNTRKKYADMGFSKRMTDFFYGAEKAKQQEAEQQKDVVAQPVWSEEALRRAQMGLPMNSNPKHESEVAEHQRRLREAQAHSNAVLKAAESRTAPIQRDISGWPVNPNRVTSLRPGAGINPGQSTYGFSSMQPSNRAGEVYTIDQWGNKRYL